MDFRLPPENPLTLVLGSVNDTEDVRTWRNCLGSGLPEASFVNDRVMMVKIGGSYVILGKIV